MGRKWWWVGIEVEAENVGNGSDAKTISGICETLPGGDSEGVRFEWSGSCLPCCWQRTKRRERRREQWQEGLGRCRPLSVVVV